MSNKLSPPRCDVYHRRAHALAIAGLLHDIGKVAAAGRISLPEAFRRTWEPLVCPLHFSGEFRTHQHALYTAYMLDQANLQSAGFSVGEVFQLAAYHHNPSGDSFDQHLLTKADWLASGHDREMTDAADEPATGLVPPLATLKWPRPDRADDTGAPRTHALPVCPLQLTASAFLPQTWLDPADYRDRCRRLSDGLVASLCGLRTDSPADCVEQLLGLLERMLHAIPASRASHHEPDVSLFDHSRLVAALAGCLAVVNESGPCDPRQIQGAYRLVQFSVGGIQAFISRSIPPLTSDRGESSEKGAAKRLRARSFYVSLVSWLLSRRILDTCGLPATHLVHNAGGRSILLLPDTDPIISRLQSAISYARDWCRVAIGNALRFDLAVSPRLTDSNFARNSTADRSAFLTTLRESGDLLAAARYENPWPHLRGADQWSEEGWIYRETCLPVDRADFLESLREFGRRLVSADHVWVSTADSAAAQRGELEILGYRVALAASRPTPSARRYALTANVTDVWPLVLTANHVPRVCDAVRSGVTIRVRSDDDDDLLDSPDKLLTFEQIASGSTDDAGRSVSYSMLGVLKADVDHLGMLFGYGFGDRSSIGRFAAAARYLDTFFKGFLAEQLRTEFPLIYTVFAGGDDLFLIGPWYDLARLSLRLSRWLGQAACGNSCVTLSAGLVFAKPTTPVSRLADHAESALYLAKAQGRSRIAYGKIAIDWEEFHRGFDLHRLLVHCVADEQAVSPTMVYRLLQYSRQALRLHDRPATGEPPRLSDLKWRAQMSYDLRRNMQPCHERRPHTRELQLALQQILDERDARRLYMATSLTLYLLRGDQT